eukprot:m.223528 g.223528  ORF g.223528 m.223528 type:complete len:392 (-) comp10936_c0_seq1:170-1345(-)
MIFAPQVAAHVEGSVAPWDVGNMSEAHCIQHLLGGEEGDFVVCETQIPSQPYMIFLLINGPPDSTRKHLGILSKDGRVHSCLMKSFDPENERVTVQWSEENGLSETVTLKERDVIQVNPRYSIRIERLRVVCTGGELHLSNMQRPAFVNMNELVYHYQNSGLIPLTIGESDVEIRLNKHCKIWSTLNLGVLPRAVVADMRVPCRISKAECEAAFALDDRETGDFVIRVADTGEQQAQGYAYTISVLGAMRVLHVAIARQNNLFVTVKQPHKQFATLSEVVEHGLTNRLDGLLLRRAFIPKNAHLSPLDSDPISAPSLSQAQPDPSAAAAAAAAAHVAEDTAAPWESLTTPTMTTSPSEPPKTFSWAKVLGGGGPGQEQIDYIYGDLVSRVF